MADRYIDPNDPYFEALRQRYGLSGDGAPAPTVPPQGAPPSRPLIPGTETEDDSERLREARRLADRRRSRQGENPWNPYDDRMPGFLGGVEVGLRYDLPRYMTVIGDALDTNWGILGGEEGDTHEDRRARIDAYEAAANRDRDWTTLEDVFDGEGVMQNIGDASLFAREMIGRSILPSVSFVVGTAAAAYAGAPSMVASGVGLTAAALSSYPMIFGDMLEYNYQATTDPETGDLDPDYNVGPTAALAALGAAAEGATQAFILKPLSNLAGGVASQLAGRSGADFLSSLGQQGITRLITAPVKWFGASAAVGGTEEAIQAYLGRVAAPGVEALSPEAFQEYGYAALGGAIAEGFMGAAVAGSTQTVNVLGGRSLRGQDIDVEGDDIEDVDSPIGSTTAFLPRDLTEVTDTLRNVQNQTFSQAIAQHEQAGTYSNPEEARRFLGRGTSFFNTVLQDTALPGTQAIQMAPSDIDSLSDTEVVRMANIAAAAGTLQATGFDFSSLLQTEVYNTGNEGVDTDRRYLAQYTNEEGNRVFDDATIALMTPRVSRELANRLQFLETGDTTKIDPSSVNIQSAVQAMTKETKEALGQERAAMLQQMEARAQQEAKRALLSANPIPAAMVRGALPFLPNKQVAFHRSKPGEVLAPNEQEAAKVWKQYSDNVIKELRKAQAAATRKGRKGIAEQAKLLAFIQENFGIVGNDWDTVLGNLGQFITDEMVQRNNLDTDLIKSLQWDRDNLSLMLGDNTDHSIEEAIQKARNKTPGITDVNMEDVSAAFARPIYDDLVSPAIQDRIEKAYRKLINNLPSAGIDPRQLLTAHPRQRLNFIAKRLPNDKGKAVREAFEELENAIQEIDSAQLFDSIASEIETFLARSRAPEVTQQPVPTLDYSDLQLVRIDPALVNDMDALSKRLSKALPGKRMEAARNRLLNAINNFDSKIDQRGMVSGLVYALNASPLEMKDSEYRSTFYILKDLGIIDDMAISGMLRALPRYKDRIAQAQYPDNKALRDTFREDLDKVADDVHLADIYVNARDIGQFPETGTFKTHIERSNVHMNRLRNEGLDRLLGDTWDTPELRSAMRSMARDKQTVLQMQEDQVNLENLFDREGILGLEPALMDPDNINMAPHGLGKWFETAQLFNSFTQLSRMSKPHAAMYDLVDGRRIAGERFSGYVKHLVNQIYPRGNSEQAAATRRMTNRAMKRLDDISATGQDLTRRAPDGGLVYKRYNSNTGKVEDFKASPEETNWTLFVNRVNKVALQLDSTMNKRKLADKNIKHKGKVLGSEGTTSKDVFDYIDTREKALEGKDTNTQAYKTARKELDTLEATGQALELQEQLLDPNKAYFPHTWSRGGENFLKTYYVTDINGNRLENPHAPAGQKEQLRIVIEVAADAKGRRIPESEQQADERAEQLLQEHYVPFYGDIGAFKLEDTTPVPRAKANQNNVSNAAFESLADDMNKALMQNGITGKQRTDLLKDFKDRFDNREITRKTRGQATRLMQLRKNVGGYNQNYPEAIQAYLGSIPYILSRSLYQDSFQRMTDILDNNVQALPPEQVETAFPVKQRRQLRDDWERITNPSRDMEMMRTLNFFLLLSFNPTTAAINYITLPFAVLPSLSAYSLNVAKNTASLTKATGTAGSIIRDSLKEMEKVYGTPTIRDRTLGLEYFENVLRKNLSKAYGDAKGETMLRAVMSSIDDLQQTIQEEVTGDSQFRELSGYYEESGLGALADNLKTLGGSFLHYAERHTRLSSFLSHMDLMTNADGSVNTDAVQNALEWHKNNERVQAILDDHKTSDMDDIYTAAALARQGIEETHGVYDKLGRGKLQRGLAGSVVMPFMTWPITMWEFMGNNLVARGARGKAALAQMLAVGLLAAGLAGAAPGAEVWKKVIEMWFKFHPDPNKRRDIDPDERWGYFLRNELGFSEQEARFIEDGIPGLMGLDLSHRVAVPLPMEGPIMGILEPDNPYAVGRTAGLIGSGYLQWGQVMAGEKNLFEGIGAMATPQAAQSLARAAEWNTTGARTARGRHYATPGQLSDMDILARALGFQPINATQARQRDFALRSGMGNYSKPAEDALVRDLVNLERRMRIYRTQGISTDVLREEYNRRYWEYIETTTGSGDAHISTTIQRRVNQRVAEALEAEIDPVGAARREGGTPDPAFQEYYQ